MCTFSLKGNLKRDRRDTSGRDTNGRDTSEGVSTREKVCLTIISVKKKNSHSLPFRCLPPPLSVPISHTGSK
jgi:hypothetical protein